MPRLLAFLLALCLWSLIATSAGAHAVLLSATPAAGSTLGSMPSRVELSFTEPVAAMAFRLLQPDSSTTALEGRAVGSKLSIDLPPVAQPGTYFVEWHVVSADGHPVAGTLALSLNAHGAAARVPELGDPVVRGMLWLTTVMAFSGAFFGVGGAAFSAFLDHPRAGARGAIVDVPLVVGAVGILVGLPLQGAESLGDPIGAVLDGGTWRAALATTYAAQAAGMLAATILAALATRLRNAAGPPLGLLALLVLCGAMALSGHVTTAEPRWLSTAALMAHVAGFCFWIGALPLLLSALARPSSRADAVLSSFSRLIVYAVGLIVASGATLAVLQLGPPSGNWLAPYGAVLVAKLGVLVALFAIAAWNRFVLTRPALRGSDRATHRLRVLVGVEIALMILVLGIVGLWRFTPPPRVLTDAARAEEQFATEDAEPIRTHLHASGIMADFELATTGSSSRATVELYADEPDADVREVRVLLVPPAEGAVPLDLKAVPAGDMRWETDVPALTAGRWIVRIEARVGDFDLVKMKGAFRVQ